jgi:hypothetical protein
VHPSLLPPPQLHTLVVPGRHALRTAVLALALSTIAACTADDASNSASDSVTSSADSVAATASAAASPVAGADTSARTDTAAVATGNGDGTSDGAAPPVDATARPRLKLEPGPIIRGLYVNRFAAQSTRRMAALIAMADSTEVNAFVIDVKDEFGLNIPSDDSILVRNAGSAGVIRNVRALMDTLKAHGILPIARIVVFKDSVAARVNPDRTIRTADGSPWRDKQGLTWVSPYDESVWEYNFRVAEEAVRLGFGEIQYDYIRFPEPYKSLPTQVFPNQRGRTKPQILAEFLRTGNERLDRLGVRTTADVFGLVTTINGALEIGQEWEALSPVVDVMLPMTYPSHYPRGAFNIARPNAEPHKVVFTAISRARERDAALGIDGQHVRPWVQAFSLGQPEYDASHVKAQMQAIYDAGYEGWVWWHPGSKYEPFLAALDRTLTPKSKPAQ